MKNQNANKNKNKGLKGVLALALAVLMTAASVLPAFATSDNGSKEKTTSIGDVYNALTENTVRAAKEVSGSAQPEYYEEDAAFYYEDEAEEVTYDFIEVDELPEEEVPAETTEEVTEETPEEEVEEVPEEEVLEIPDVKLSDKPEDRNKNVMGLAAAYIGWGESLRDYKEYTDGTVVGSTIFGESQNENYKAWNVSFVSYILQQAGIEDLPVVKNMGELVKELKDEQYAGRIMNADDYEPVEGDLVLLGLPGKKLSEINAPKKQESFDDLDASAYNPAGAGVAAGLIGASTVASENKKDNRKEAIYTRVGFVVSKEKKAVTDDEGKEVKDARGKVVEHTFLTVIEGDVEDPVVAGNTEIDAQYRMTGVVEEVEYDLDEMTLTYDDIKDLEAEEIEELKKTSPQVLDYIVLYVEEEEEVEEPAPTPAPTPVESISSAEIKEDGIGAGVALGLAVKPQTEQTGSAAAREALANTDLSSLRLLIGTENESIFKGDDRVVAGYNGIYLLQAETLKEAEEAFLAYYDKADFVAPDVAVAIAEGETDEDPEEEILNTETVYTEEENPFAELETALEDVPAAPKRNVRRIALIDTGAAQSDNVIEAVSMIGEDGADDNGHGERMVGFILSQDPEAEIISIKALGADGVGDISAVIAGINYAMENKASIINLSMAAYASEENAALADAIRKATEAGITVIGAAGNQGFNAKYYIPANIAEALIVGAADEDGNRIAASNYGETVDYNVAAETTSEAAAKLSGFISANGADAIDGALNAGLIFATDYVGEDRSGEEYEGAVAQAGNTASTWAELQDAIAGAPTNGTVKEIKLTADLIAETIAGKTPNGSIKIEGGRKIKLTADSPQTIYRKFAGNDTNFSMFIVGANSALTIGNNITLTGEQAITQTNTTTQTTTGKDLVIGDANNKWYLVQNGSLYNIRIGNPANDSAFVPGSDAWELEESPAGSGRYNIKNKAVSQYLQGDRAQKIVDNSNYLAPKTYYRRRITVGAASSGGYFTKNANGDILFVPSEDTSKNEGLFFDPSNGQGGAAYAMSGQDASTAGYQQSVITITTQSVVRSTNQCPYWKNAGDGSVNKTFTSGTSESPKGFFVTVNSGGTLNIEGNAKFEKFNTVNNDDTPSNVAPIVANGGTIVMTGGSIENNRVGYNADDDKSTLKTNTPNNGVNANIKNYVNNLTRTNTAGGMIIKGSANVTITGTASINNNRGDAGGIILTDRSTLNMGTVPSGYNTTAGGSINDNVGIHHAGAVLVEDGAKLIMDNGAMRNNITWTRGGAVWATEWGTSGAVSKNWGTHVVNNPGDKCKNGGGFFIMNNGVLEGNYAFQRGGAINVESNGVQLNGGEITGNRCRVLGGAIYVEGDFPDYSYTLQILRGYIGENEAIANVSDSELDKVLNADGSFSYDNYGEGRGDTRDFNGHMGNGGGVWLCPIGGSSVFSLGNSEYQVILDQNKLLTGNKSGTDFFLERGSGSLTVQGLGSQGTWKRDPGSATLTADPLILSGSLGLINTGTTDLNAYNNNYGGAGVKIYDNRSRDGGGIAANGTLLIGKTTDIYRFEGDMDIFKGWSKAIVNPQSARFEVKYSTADNPDPENPADWHTLTGGNAVNVSGNTNTEAPKDFELFKDVPTDNGNTTDNDVDRQVAESNLVWKYHMSLPSIVNVEENGQIRSFALYKFKYNGRVYSPTNPTDMKDLYNVVNLNGTATETNGPKSLEVEVVEWKIRITETGATANGQNSGFEISSGAYPRKAVLTAKKPIVNQTLNTEGNAIANFSVNFTTGAFRQSFYNDLKPTVEKYVNYDVHKEINYNEEFQYDVMAYVPLNATSIEIKDELVEILEFATDSNNQIKGLRLSVLTAENETEENIPTNNRNARNGDTYGTVYTGNYNTIDLTSDRLKVEGKTITVTLNAARTADAALFNIDGPANGVGTIRGHWVKLTFKARLTSFYQVPENLSKYLKEPNVLNGNSGVWETVKDQNSYEGTHTNYTENNSAKKNGGVNTNVYNRDNPHVGIANNAQYKVNNKAEYNSNTVTVKPVTSALTLTKKDKDTNETLEDVHFALYKADGTKAKEGRTNDEGQLTFAGLVPGTYYVEETRPNGYKDLNKRIIVTVNDAGKVNYAGVGSVVGLASNGQLTLNGQKLYVNRTSGDLAAGDGVTTTPTQYPLYVKADTTPSSQPVSKLGTGTYYIQAGNTDYYLSNQQTSNPNEIGPQIEKTIDLRSRWIGTEMTTGAGVVTLKNGRTGTPGNTFIYMEDGAVKLATNLSKAVTTDALVSGAASTIDNNDLELTVKNEKQNFKVTVKKIDKDNNNAGIQNIGFNVYKADGTPAGNGRTNTSGLKEFNNLQEGTYYMFEDAASATTAGYSAINERIIFTIGADGTVSYAGVGNVVGVASNGQLVLNGQRLYLNRSTGDPVATDKVTTNSGNGQNYPLIVKTGYTGDAKPVKNLAVNTTYWIQVGDKDYYLCHTGSGEPFASNADNFSWEKYKWLGTEKEAGKGVVALKNLRNQDQRFLYMDGNTVKLGTNMTSAITSSTAIQGSGTGFDIQLSNERKDYPVTIKKVDSNNTTSGLSGAKFQLYKGDTNNKVGGVETTNTSGAITISGLKWGDYSLEEVEPPAGYNKLLGSARVKFTIAADGTVSLRGGSNSSYGLSSENGIDIYVKNEEKLYNVDVLKKNYEGTTLPGATFKLWRIDENGKTEITTANPTTGNNGKVSFANLKAGNYYLEETGRPAGYERLTGKIYFSIAKDQNGTKTLKGYVEEYSVDGTTGQLMIGGKKLYVHLPAGASLPATANATLSNVTISTEPSDYPLITRYYKGNSNLQQDALVTSLVENDEYRFQLGTTSCYLWGIGKDRQNPSQAGIAYQNVSNGCWWKYVKVGNDYALQNQWGIGQGSENMAYVCFDGEQVTLSTLEEHIYCKGTGKVVDMTDNGSSIELTVRDRKEKVKVSIPVNKQLTSNGNTVSIKEGDFKFLLEKKSAPTGMSLDQMPMPSVNPVTVGASNATTKIAEAVFKDIEFETPGTYVYTISETDKSNPNMTYDNRKYDVTIVVSEADQTNGRLVATVSYAGVAGTVVFPENGGVETQGEIENGGAGSNRYIIEGNALEPGVANTPPYTEYGPDAYKSTTGLQKDGDSFIAYCLNATKTRPAQVSYMRQTVADYNALVAKLGTGSGVSADAEKKIIAMLYYGYGGAGYEEFIESLRSNSVVNSFLNGNNANKDRYIAQMTQYAIWGVTDPAIVSNTRYEVGYWWDSFLKGTYYTNREQNKYHTLNTSTVNALKKIKEELEKKTYDSIPDSVKNGGLRLDIYVTDNPAHQGDRQNMISLNCIVSGQETVSGRPTFHNDGTQAWAIKIKKKNGNNNQDLTGAVFTLYRSEADMNARQNGVTIDGSNPEKSEFRWGNLTGTATGTTYYIVEEQAPAGFTRISEPIKVKITVTGDIGNQTARIEKVGNLPDGVTLNGNNPTDGEFLLTANNYHYNFQFGKVDSSNSPINHNSETATATFKLMKGSVVKYVSVPTGNGNLYTFVEADADGKAKVGSTPETTNIDADTYTLVEEVAPFGYDKSTTATTITVSYVNNKIVLTFPNGSGVTTFGQSGAVVLTGATVNTVVGQDASINNNNDHKFNVQNKTNLVGDIAFKKTVVDANNNTVSGDGETFTFRVTLRDETDSPITESKTFWYTKTGSDAKESKPFTKESGDTSVKADFELKHGQTITILDLPAGWNYTIEEINPPAGYTSQTAAQTDVVKPMRERRETDNPSAGGNGGSGSSGTSSAGGASAEAPIENYDEIQIAKFNATDKTAISGIWFEVTRVDGSDAAQYIWTGDDGIAKLSSLTEGQYLVRELMEGEAKRVAPTKGVDPESISYPDQLIVDRAPRTVTIGTGEAGSESSGNKIKWANETLVPKEFKNKRVPNIEIEKFDLVYGVGMTPNPEDETTWVEFKLLDWNTDEVKYVSRHIGDNKYSFISYPKKDGSDNPENYGVVPGTYKLQETTVPTGYETPQPVKVVISQPDAQGKVTITFPDNPAYAAASTDKNNTIIFRNTPQSVPKTLEAEKTVNSHPIDSGSEYDGAFTFNLYEAEEVADNNSVKYRKVGDVLEGGSITNDGSKVEFNSVEKWNYNFDPTMDLPADKWYWLEESVTPANADLTDKIDTDPTRYLIHHRLYLDGKTFKVDQTVFKLADGEEPVTKLNEAAVAEADVDFNNISKGSLEVKKTLAGNAKDTNSSFEIYIKLTKANGTTPVTTDELRSEGVTVAFSNLQNYSGTQLSMGKAPANTKAWVKIKKNDGTYEMTLVDLSSTEDIYLKVGNGQTPKLKGGETLTITGLHRGWKYTVYEKDCSEDGYVTTISEGEAAITGKDSPRVEVFNARHEIRIKKTGDGDEALPGAEFTVYRRNADGTNGDALPGTMRTAAGTGYAELKLPRDVVETVMTNGSIQLNLVETKAPAGYLLPTAPWILTIEKGDNPDVEGNFRYSLVAPGGEEITPDSNDRFEIDNTPVYELPNSGGIGTYWFTIFGTIFLALAGVFAFNMADKKRRALAKARASQSRESRTHDRWTRR